MSLPTLSKAVAQMTVSNAVLRTSVCCSIYNSGVHRKWQTYKKSMSASDFA
jgi:hypothetical protein